MGILDDAIREHLELKRRRGADPGEVAREQREVLDSVVGEEGGAGPADPETAPEALTAAPDAGGGAPDHEGTPAQRRPADVAAEELVVTSDETAELDMASVLGAEAAEGAAAVDHPDAIDPPAGEHGESESQRSGDVPPEIPGQERLSFE